MGSSSGINYQFKRSPRREGGERWKCEILLLFIVIFLNFFFYTFAMISSPDHFPCSSDRPVGARRNHEGVFCYLFFIFFKLGV